MIPTAAVLRELRDLTARRRRLGLTVHALAHVARLRSSRVCHPDGVALLRLHWALIRLEQGWSLQQVRQVIEYRLRNAGSQATASAAVAGGASTPAGGGGGRRT